MPFPACRPLRRNSRRRARKSSRPSSGRSRACTIAHALASPGKNSCLSTPPGPVRGSAIGVSARASRSATLRWRTRSPYRNQENPGATTACRRRTTRGRWAGWILRNPSDTNARQTSRVQAEEWSTVPRAQCHREELRFVRQNERDESQRPRPSKNVQANVTRGLGAD